jgi:hypothetical protein
VRLARRCLNSITRALAIRIRTNVMTYQSLNPATGKLLKKFDELTDKELGAKVATAATCFVTWRRRLKPSGRSSDRARQRLRLRIGRLCLHRGYCAREKSCQPRRHWNDVHQQHFLFRRRAAVRRYQGFRLPASASGPASSIRPGKHTKEARITACSCKSPATIRSTSTCPAIPTALAW